MPNRGLLVAVALLAVLAGAIYWSNQDEEKKAKEPAKDAPPKVLEIAEDQFNRLELKHRDGSAVVLEKKPAGWVITAPRELPADPAAVQTLVSTLSSLTSDRLVDEKPANLMQYGLASPPLEVIIGRKDGKTTRLQFGEDTPTASGTYAQVEGDPRLFTIATATKSALDKGWPELRDRRVLPFNAEKLSRVELNAEGETLEFSKNASGNWAILKPRPLRADNFAVEELVRRLVEAKMEILPEPAEQKLPAQFAAALPIATAKATDDRGTHQIEVRKDAAGAYLARSSVLTGTYQIPAEIGEGFSRRLADFRDKKLFDFGFQPVDRVDIRYGDKSWSFTKSGEDWSSGGKKVDAAAVQQLIDKLRELRATTLLEQGSGKMQAELSVTLSQGKGVEKVTVTDTHTATRAGESGAYAVDAKLVEELRDAAAAIK